MISDTNIWKCELTRSIRFMRIKAERKSNYRLLQNYDTLQMQIQEVYKTFIKTKQIELNSIIFKKIEEQQEIR